MIVLSKIDSNKYSRKLCVNQSPGRGILLNYEVVEFQASVSDRLILRLCRLSITLLYTPSAPQLFLPFYGSFILFLPPPGHISYSPPSFTCWRCFSLSLHPLLPPPLLLGCGEIAHSDKYVSIYVTIRPMNYDSLQLRYSWH